MSGEIALFLSLAIPSLGAVMIALASLQPNLRECVTLTTAVLLFGVVLRILLLHEAGAPLEVELLEVVPGLPLALSVEPLGMALRPGRLGPLDRELGLFHRLYARQQRGPPDPLLRLLRGRHRQRHGHRLCRQHVHALHLLRGADALDLSLVTHKGSDEARAGGRTYLGILIGTSIGLQLVAIVWTWTLTGTLDFTAGGILSGKAEGPLVAILLALYMFGIGKAALMPFHRWLPAAMVAPTPVSALLHAVAVVKAGVFTVLKVAIYIFGIDFLAETGASDWLVWAAAFTILCASLVAMSKDNLKARLAYSTVSQLSYVVLGAALATSMGVMGGAMQIAMHAVGKITLFFCAGAIYVATHKTEISDMQGLGRVMPFTFGAFFIGALSIIGLPPMGGSWSKWYLMLGAAETEHQIMIVVLMVSSLLNIAYLMPLIARGFFLPAPEEPLPQSAGAAAAPPREGIREAPLFCVVPLCCTAAGCVLLFFFADALYALLSPLSAGGG